MTTENLINNISVNKFIAPYLSHYFIIAWKGSCEKQDELKYQRKRRKKRENLLELEKALNPFSPCASLENSISHFTRSVL